MCDFIQEIDMFSKARLFRGKITLPYWKLPSFPSDFGLLKIQWSTSIYHVFHLNHSSSICTPEPINWLLSSLSYQPSHQRNIITHHHDFQIVPSVLYLNRHLQIRLRFDVTCKLIYNINFDQLHKILMGSDRDQSCQVCFEDGSTLCYIYLFSLVG